MIKASVESRVDSSVSEHEKQELEGTIRDVFWPCGDRISSGPDGYSKWKVECGRIQMTFTPQSHGTSVVIRPYLGNFITSFGILSSVILGTLWTFFWIYYVDIVFGFLSDDYTYASLYQGWGVVIALSLVFGTAIKIARVSGLNKRIREAAPRLIDRLNRLANRGESSGIGEGAPTEYIKRHGFSASHLSHRVDRPLPFDDASLRDFLYSLCEVVLRRHGEIEPFAGGLQWSSKSGGETDVTVTSAAGRTFVDLKADLLRGPVDWLFPVFLWLSVGLWTMITIGFLRNQYGFETMGVMGALLKQWGGLLSYWVVPLLAVAASYLTIRSEGISFHEKSFAKLIAAVEKIASGTYPSILAEIPEDKLGFPDLRQTARTGWRINRTMDKSEKSGLQSAIQKGSGIMGQLHHCGYTLHYGEGDKMQITFTPRTEGTEIGFWADLSGFVKAFAMRFSIVLVVLWIVISFAFPGFIGYVKGGDNSSLFFAGIGVSAFLSLILAYAARAVKLMDFDRKTKKLAPLLVEKLESIDHKS